MHVHSELEMPGANLVVDQDLSYLQTGDETFWETADRYGSYIFTAIFILVGMVTPVALFFYSLTQ